MSSLSYLSRYSRVYFPLLSPNSFFFFLMIPRPPRSTLFPYTNALPILNLGVHDVRIFAVNLQTDPSRIATVLVDRKSTRLNSSHQIISYAVFCLKKKKKIRI